MRHTVPYHHRLGQERALGAIGQEGCHKGDPGFEFDHRPFAIANHLQYRGTAPNPHFWLDLDENFE